MPEQQKTGTTVPSTPLRMRKLNLNLPDDYYKRLNRPARGPFGLKKPSQQARVKAVSSSELSSTLKKLLSLKTSIEIKRDHGKVQINLSGVTSELTMPRHHPKQRGRTTLGVNVGYNGTFAAYKSRTFELGPGVKLKEKVSTASGQPFRIEYTHQKLAIALTFKSNDKKGMSFDRWEFSVAWGKAGPDIHKLKEIVTNGEAAVRGVYGALKTVQSLDDVKSVSESVKPHIEPIKKSVDTAASIMGIQSGLNISFKIQGPIGRTRLPVGASIDERRNADVRGMIYLTVRF